MSGREACYKPLARILASGDDTEKEAVWENSMPALIKQVYMDFHNTEQVQSVAELENLYANTSVRDYPPRYDAILVDEGTRLHAGLVGNPRKSIGIRRRDAFRC